MVLLLIRRRARLLILVLARRLIALIWLIYARLLLPIGPLLLLTRTTSILLLLMAGICSLLLPVPILLIGLALAMTWLDELAQVLSNRVKLLRKAF